MAGAVENVRAGECHKERRESVVMTVGVGLVSGKIPADLLFRGSCNNASRTRVVEEKTERKRRVRDV